MKKFYFAPQIVYDCYKNIYLASSSLVNYLAKKFIFSANFILFFLIKIKEIIIILFNLLRLGLLVPCGLQLTMFFQVIFLISTALLLSFKLTLESYSLNLDNFTLVNINKLIFYIFVIIFLLLIFLYMLYCVLAIFFKSRDLGLLILNRNKAFYFLDGALKGYFVGKLKFGIIITKLIYFIINFYFNVIFLKLFFLAINHFYLLANFFLKSYLGYFADETGSLYNLELFDIGLILFVFIFVLTFLYFMVAKFKNSVDLNITLEKEKNKEYIKKITSIESYLIRFRESVGLAKLKKNPRGLDFIHLTNSTSPYSLAKQLFFFNNFNSACLFFIKLIILILLFLAYYSLILVFSSFFNKLALILGVISSNNISENLNQIVLCMLPEEYLDRKLISDKEYSLRLSSPHLLNLNLEGGSNQLNTGLDSNNPGIILNDMIAQNKDKEQIFIKLLEKQVKALSKSNIELNHNVFVAKNKLALKNLYDANFRLITKSYMSTELIKGYNSKLGETLHSLRNISPHILLEMEKNPLLNANWELVSNISKKSDIIAIPKDPFGTYEPFVESYTFLSGEVSRIKTLTTLISDKRFIGISEKYLLNKDTLPLKLYWVDNKLVFNYNYKVIIDNKEFWHNLNFAHLFPALNKLDLLNKGYYENLYKGPISKYINPDHFVLSDVLGEVGLVRVTLPSEFNFSIPNSICYNRENLEAIFNLNLKETDWLFDQSSLTLEKFSMEGFIINITLDKDLLSIFGWRDYLNKVFFPALDQIEAPFVNVVGSKFLQTTNAKNLLFLEDGLQLFNNDLFSLKFDSKKKIEILDIIQRLNFETEVHNSLKISLINLFVNDYPVNQNFELDYSNLNLIDFLLKKGIIIDENYVYLFLSKNENFSKLISEAIELDSSKIFFIKIPLKTPENILTDSELNPQSIAYLKKEIGNFTKKTQLSKSELELVKKLVKKITS